MTEPEIVGFTVPGEPKPHPRPRACIRGSHASVYTPKPAQDRKYIIQKYGQAAMGERKPYTGAVMAKLTFVMPRPKNLIWKTKPMDRIKHTRVGDCDNLAKGVLDALNGVVYLDDSQVWCLVVTKWVADGLEGSRTDVVLEVEDCETR
jgi:Holliday junction resolvase RusA-like endonuclease